MSHAVKMREEALSKLFMSESLAFSAFQQPTENVPQQALPKLASAAHFMQAISLELMVKILYIADHKQSAPLSHEIKNLFNSLNDDTKEFIENLYNEARKRHQALFEGKASEETITFPTLIKILEQNEDMIQDIKHDAILKADKFAMDGEFYQNVFAYLRNKVAEAFPEK